MAKWKSFSISLWKPSLFLDYSKNITLTSFFYYISTILDIIFSSRSQNYIYWLISTENDHRHHHKFIKYKKRLRKEGNMLGLTINNNQAKSLPLQREIWRVALPWVRSIQRQRSNWSTTYILHLFHLEDTSLLFLFISESVKVRFLPRVDSFSFAQEPHVVYCF